MTARNAPNRRLLSRGFGWFSIMLGAPSVLAPRFVDDVIGVRPTDGSRAVTRAVGLQELTVGAGLLRRRRRRRSQWSRIAGDIGHLMLLRRALTSGESDRRRVTRTIAIVSAITAADLIAAMRLRRGSAAARSERAVRAGTAITVRRPVVDVYRYWRDLQNLPRFMTHLESVRAVGDGRSHWVARAPAGKTVQWDAEIVADRPNERIAWRSLEGARIDNSGSVRFRRAARSQGTEVIVELEYIPPAGALGATVAKLFGEEPNQQIRDDLRRFKQVLETGEVVRSAGSPDGSKTQRQLKQRRAQPPDTEGSRA